MHPDPLKEFIWYDKRKPALENLAKSFGRAVRWRQKLYRGLRPWRTKWVKALAGFMVGGMVTSLFTAPIMIVVWATAGLLVLTLYFCVIVTFIALNRHKLTVVAEALFFGEYGAAMGRTLPSWKTLEAALAMLGYSFNDLRQNNNEQITPHVAQYLERVMNNMKTGGISPEAHRDFMDEQAQLTAREIAEKLLS